MQPLLCYFKSPPEGLEGPVSLWLKARLQAALDAKLEPALLPSVGLQRLSVAMPPAMALRIRELAEQWGVAPGRMVGMLSAALDGRRQQGKTEQVANETGAKVDRPEQIRLLAAAAPLLDAGRIVLIEAGTGVGKSRLAGRLAQHCLGAGAATVVVATPTVAQLANLAGEFESLRSSGTAGSLPEPSLLLGRANFVDLDAALEFAHAADHTQALEWLDAGAPAGLTDASRAMAASIPGAKGLMVDWMHLVDGSEFLEDMGVDDFCLTEDSSEESSALYTSLRARAKDCPLVLCTHAMLAADCIAKKREHEGMLESIDLLVLDEAHTFEEELAKVASQSVSLWSLQRMLRRETWTALRAGKLAGEALEAVSASIELLARLPFGGSQSLRLPADLTSEPAIARAWPGCEAALDRLQLALVELSKKLGQAKEAPGWRNAQRQVQQAARALEAATNGRFTVEVSLSPVRRLASLSIGPRSVAHYLNQLWDDCRAAALMSATLYVPKGVGDSSYYITRTLALPAERVSQTVAEHPAWITSTPVLMLPEARRMPLLTPPSGDAISTNTLVPWLEEVARVVEHVAATAAGGTLVLMSGYERLDILARALQDSLGKRLVVQGRNKGVARCESEFRALAAKGRRPVWLATGGAWTGLDLRDRQVPDERAMDDLLLTDLVIPNVPIGLNRATTHAARRESFRPVEGMSTGLMFRQGLGRLIRRPGLVKRRIWMLDTRLLVRSATSSGSLYSPCLLMLDRFNRHERFALAEDKATS